MQYTHTDSHTQYTKTYIHAHKRTQTHKHTETLTHSLTQSLSRFAVGFTRREQVDHEAERAIH